MSKKKTPIAVAAGDGIGPEIMEATLNILDKAGAALDIQHVEIGEKVYLQGELTGIAPTTWDVIRHAKAFLKGPITTPQGGGFKSLNVTIRTALGLYANIRPCVAYYPFVSTKHPGMNVVIVRENEEDLYMGIEYRQTPECFEALKMMTRQGCERIIRYAFEYALTNERKKVTCFTKDNILKLSDGLFHKTFEEIGLEYPQLEKEHWIIDIGSAKLADTPEAFDVVVMPNLYGDILSDVAAQIAGSVGLAGSANIGTSGAMFEAIHGSAPRRAGQNLANPSGLLLAAVQMLIHIGQPDCAALVHNAWLKTLEDGIHTYDIYKEKISKERVGTREFAQAVESRIGEKPHQLPSVHYTSHRPIKHAAKSNKSEHKKELVGIDLFIHWESSLETLLQKLASFDHHDLELKMISNRGVKVWPEKHPETICCDNWRCRFIRKDHARTLTQKEVLTLIQKVVEGHLEIVQTHFLSLYDGQPGYT
jgi:isocitrate dehydrogenase